jgi:hypothetical protein
MSKEQRESTSLPRRSLAESFVIAWQMIVVVFLLLVVGGSLSLNVGRLDVPGAPALLFWCSVTAGVVVILANAPPVFLRFAGVGRGIIYIASLLYLVLWMSATEQVRAAWERTPRGAAEARQAKAAEEAEARRQKAADDAEAAADQRQREFQKTLREGQQAVAELQERADQLESCFTYFGHHLPALEKAVKESLQNPHSFEHVETVAIVPDDDHNDVAMTFRAENGFGALRTAVVKASVVPETCEVVSIEKPQLL